MTVAKPTDSPAITVAQLEASYPAYCKALRMLVRDGLSLSKIQRTVCWGRLETLHHCLPRHYKSPQYLYAQLTRDTQKVAI